MRASGKPLGNVEPRPTIADVIELRRTSAVIVIAYIVVSTSVVLVLGWLAAAMMYVADSGAVSSMTSILNSVTPFWSGVTGVVLGYLCSRGDQLSGKARGAKQ